MTYHRFDDKFDLPNRFNTAICDDCGALIPVGDQETHDAREAKINAWLTPAQVAEEPKPRPARPKKEEV